MRVLAVLACVATVAWGRMAYQFSAGSENLLQFAPRQTFSCEGRNYGYYADVDNDCKIFHVCNPQVDGEGQVLGTEHFSFMCGNGTVFSQESLTCTHDLDGFACSEAPTLYDLVNSEFGRIPDDQPQ